MLSSKQIRLGLAPCAATLLVLSACQTDPVISTLQPLNPQTANTRVVQSARPIAAPIANSSLDSLLDYNSQPAPQIPERSALVVDQEAPAANSAPTTEALNQSQSQNTASGMLNTTQRVPIEALRVSQSFDYASTQDVDTLITVHTPNGNPYRAVAVAIYAVTNESKVAVTRGITDENGVFKQVVRVPSYHKALNFEVSAFGLANNRTLPIQNGQIQYTFGQ